MHRVEIKLSSEIRQLLMIEGNGVVTKGIYKAINAFLDGKKPTKKKTPKKKDPEAKLTCTELIKEYVSQFKTTYGVEPKLGAKENAQLSKMLDTVGRSPKGIEESCEIIRRYFKTDDPFIRKNRHSIGPLLANINRFITPTDDELNDQLFKKLLDLTAKNRVKIFAHHLESKKV